MFVEVKRRNENKTPFLVNTDHVRDITWEADGESVVGVLIYSNGDKVTIDLGPSQNAPLWDALHNLSGVSIEGNLLG